MIDPFRSLHLDHFGLDHDVFYRVKLDYNELGHIEQIFLFPKIIYNLNQPSYNEP